MAKGTGAASSCYRNAEPGKRGPAYGNVPKRKRNFPFGLMAIVLTAVVTGVVIGNVAFNLIPHPTKIVLGDEWEYSEKDYLAAHARANPYSSPSEAESALELFEICYAELLAEPYVSSDTDGWSRAAGIRQTIVNHRRFDAEKNYLYAETSTTGMIKLLERYYYDVGKNDMIVAIDGAGTYEMTIGEYLPIYGSSPRGFLNYLVNADTVIEEEPIRKNADGNYVLTFTMDPAGATENYVRQVYHLAGGESPMPENKTPIYESVKLTYIVSEEFRILEADVKERYKVFQPLKVTCDSEIKETFDYSPVVFTEDQLPSAVK